MKVFSIIPGQDGRLSVEAGVDSAVLRPGEPVFIPDPVDQWRTAVAPAIRISRLGTAIKAARARSYYSEIAAVHTLRPAPGSDAAHGLPPAILDRAFSPGRWLPLPEDSSSELSLSVSRSAIGEADPEPTTVTFTLATLQVDQAIALLSEFITFKTGDILVFPSVAVSLGTPILDTHIAASVCGEPSLDIRIK